jgi:hypothetical protein
MSPIYFSVGGLVFAIALFKRELLTRKESFVVILAVSAALFVTGLVLNFTEPGRDSACGALLCPLLSLGLYQLYRWVFIKSQRREPVDTWLSWQSGTGADRLFNVAYFVSAFWLWIVVTIVMAELAKTNW